MPDVTKLIEADHREVEGLFAEFEQQGTKQAALRICQEIERHAGAEETVFYPAVREEVPEGSRLVGEGEHEHAQARQLIGRIKNTDDEAHLSALVMELEQAIHHHVEEEETEMLPKARESMDQARLQALASEFDAAKT
jgi:hemerythrin superfamily protein